MAISNLVLDFAGQSGVNPRLGRLDTTESYEAITAPGFLNGFGNGGIEVRESDFIFASYNGGANTGMFNVVRANDGIFTMQVYNPNSNSFTYNRVQFVAKGGSNLNTGTQLGYPKLTIQAAINALAMTSTSTGVVVVMDSETYNENLVLPFGIKINAPYATLKCDTGDLITINDTGIKTSATLIAGSLYNSGSGLAINLLGSQSSLFVDCGYLHGDMYLEGKLVDGVINDLESSIEIDSTGIFGTRVINASSLTFTLTSGATIAGNIQVVESGSVTNAIYGDQTVVDRLIYQTDPSTLTAGKTLAVSDSNKRIVYNSATPDNFVLPKTEDVAIPLGTNVEFTQLGLGAAVFEAGTGVTIVSALGSTVETNGAGASAKAYKYTDTVWIISGDIAAVS